MRRYLLAVLVLILAAAGLRSLRALAYHRVRPQDASPIVLELEQDYTLRVRVVDSLGAPAPGLRVLAEVHHGSSIHEVPATTAEDGVATFFHLGLGWGLDHAHSGGRVLVEGLLEPRLEAVFDFRSFPERALELALPPHGSVVVEVVDGAGAPAQVSGRVRLSCVPAQQPVGLLRNPSNDPWAEVEGGRAHFPLVGLGLAVEAELDDRPEHGVARVRFEGPVGTGQESTARLELSDPTAVIRFRVLAPSGEPQTGRELDARLLLAVSGSTRSSSAWLTTEGDGFVRLPMTETWNEGTRLTLTLRCESPQGEGGLEGSLDLSRSLSPGVNELGDVVLREADVLVAGRVLDGSGQPVNGASVILEQSRISASGRESWSQMHRVHTGPDGRFALYDDPPAEALRLRVESKAHVAFPPMPLIPGSRELEIVLLQGGGLQGSVRAPDGVPPRAFRVLALDRQGATLRDVRPGASGRFGLIELPPGPVDVAVRLQSHEENLSLITEVQVPQGETRSDARLEDIDLTTAVRQLVVRVYAADGTPCRSGWVRIVKRLQGPLMAAFVIDEGEARVLGRARPLDLEVDVPGHRTVRLTEVDSDQEVHLEPAFEVKLALPLHVELPPDGATLQVRLSPIGLPPQHLTLLKDGDPVGWWSPKSRSFDSTREVVLDVRRSGRHHVVFALVYGDPNSAFLSADLPASSETPLVLLPEDQDRTFPVAPDPTAYAKRLR